MSTSVLGPRRVSMAPTLLFSMAAVFVCADASAQVPTFQQAFDRESAELQATKAGLAKALDALEHESVQHKTRLEADIHRTESSILALQGRLRELSSSLDSANEQAQVSGEGAAALEALLSNADKRRSSKGEVLNVEDKDVAPRFTAFIDAAVQELENHFRPHVQEGSFFDAGGVRTTGKLIYIGDIAVFGVAPSAGGILTRSPAGFRVLDRSSRSQAEALLVGEAPPALDLFLLSPECTGHESTREHGLIATTNKGGPVAWIILGLAGLALVLIIERMWTLTRQSGLGGPSFDKVAMALRASEFSEASRLAGRMGVVGRAIQAVIEHRTLPRVELEKRVSESVLKTMPLLERSLTLLVVITAVAPLLGLLGTVTGMISTFDVITEFGTGDPKLLSGGISEALITTEFGLAVAVPILLVRSLIARWSDRLAENMQTYALASINLLPSKEDAHER